MSDGLIIAIIFFFWIGLQVCDFEGEYVIEKGLFGGYTATPFATMRDGAVVLTIIYGIYKCTQGFHMTLIKCLFLVSPWLIKNIYIIIKRRR